MVRGLLADILRFTMMKRKPRQKAVRNHRGGGLYVNTPLDFASAKPNWSSLPSTEQLQHSKLRLLQKVEFAFSSLRIPWNLMG